MTAAVPSYITFGEIAAALTVLSGVWAGIIYLLSGRFIPRTEYEAKCMDLEAGISAARVRAEECHQKHDLTAQPISVLAQAVQDLKTSIDQMRTGQQERHEALMKEVGQLNTRTAVLEATPRRRK